MSPELQRCNLCPPVGSPLNLPVCFVWKLLSHVLQTHSQECRDSVSLQSVKKKTWLQSWEAKLLQNTKHQQQVVRIWPQQVCHDKTEERSSRRITLVFFFASCEVLEDGPVKITSYGNVCKLATDLDNRFIQGWHMVTWMTSDVTSTILLLTPLLPLLPSALLKNSCSGQAGADTLEKLSENHWKSAHISHFSLPTILSY